MAPRLPKVALTGAGGFIGSAVLRALLQTGAEVRGHLGAPGDTVCPHPGVETLVADIEDRAAMDALVAGRDVLVHLAGRPSVRESFDHPVQHARVHVMGTVTLLEAARAAGVRRMVFISSAEVYGAAQRQPVAENAPLAPRSPYGAAKAAAEAFMLAYARTHSLEVTILRPFSTYGEGMSGAGVFSSALRQARISAEIVLDDLEPVRDFCYVDDVARAIVGAAFSPRCGTWNVGTGVGTSVATLARAIAAALGRDIPVTQRAGGQRPCAAEIDALVADVTRARDELAWSASLTLREGIARTIGSFHRPLAP